MAGPAVVFTQLAYYQVNLAASHAAGLVWSKRIGDLSVLYFLRIARKVPHVNEYVFILELEYKKPDASAHIGKAVSQEALSTP